MRFRAIPPPLLIAALLGSWAAPPSFAAEMTHPGEISIAPAFPDTEQLVGISPVIFHGTVSGLRYGRHETSPVPYTFVTFSGVEFLRKDSDIPGEGRGTLEISFLGGLRDNLHIVEVEEFPTFELGERYVVFLRGGGWRLTPIAGGGAGKGVYRLKGRVEDDETVTALDGTPIAGIEGKRFIRQDPPPRDEGRGEVDVGRRERPLPPGVEKRLREDSSRRDADALEKREAATADKPRPAPREDPVRYPGKGDVFRVSDLGTYIKQVAGTASKAYREFGTLYLQPVPRQTDKIQPREMKP